MRGKGIWFWLSAAFGVLAVLCLPWAPTRFGTLFFGALALGCACEGWFVKNSRKKRAFSLIAMVGRVLFCLFLLSFILIQGVIEQGLKPDDGIVADYVFVLGARVYESGQPSAALVSRLDRARAYLDEHEDAVAVLCGGQGDNEPMPEAEAMRIYLTARGVPESRLLIEDQSRNTIQNIDNAKALIEQMQGGEPYQVLVVSSDFHCARARRLMLHAGLDAYALPAHTPYLAQRIVLRCREYGSILGLMLTGRW